jgi:beta-glucanase (GH16 family)
MGWDLTWQDEFDGVVVDSAKWDKCFYDGVRTGWPPDPHGQEWQYYTDEDCYVENGYLRLRAQKRDYVVGADTWHYTSGMVSSALKFYQLYGKFEARIRMPRGVNGFWPAFWMCANPDPHVWPPEIDMRVANSGGGNESITEEYQ